MKILFLGATVGTRSDKLKSYLLAIASPDTKVDVVRIEKGPTSIETFHDEAFSIPEVLKLVNKFKTQYDAIIINCFGDPGVHAARELANIPIIGPGATSMHVAALLGHKFAVISIMKNAGPWTELQARETGLEGKLAYAVGIDIPVLELEADEKRTVEEIIKEGKKAIDEYNAEVIVLGCCGMISVAKTIETRLKVPVIEPVATSLAIAEALVRTGLKHSRAHLYMYPNLNKITGYNL